MRATPTPAVLLSLGVVATFNPAEALAQRPVITRASADLDSGILTLEGTNFGPSPVVSMGTSEGTFDQLTILAAPNDNQIQARLVNTAPGAYLVVVRIVKSMRPSPMRSNPSRSVWRYRRRALRFGFINLTLGAAAPSGPGPLQDDLTAEEVAGVYPDLVMRGAGRRLGTMPHGPINALLLNEIQKQERRIRHLELQLQTLMEMRSSTRVETQ